MEFEDSQKIAQAAEAESRRKKIGERYNLTDEEASNFSPKLQEVVDSLSDESTLQDVAAQYDSIVTNSEREEQIKQALVDSMVGKVSESIRYFLPEQAKEELKDILLNIENQLEDKVRIFNTFEEIYNHLANYRDVFQKYGINEEEVAKAYIAEAKKFNQGKP